MMKLVLCVCAALACTSLLGCGGGGDTPKPAPKDPLITASPYTFPDIANGTLVFDWKEVGTDKIHVGLTATVTGGALKPGWLAIGWSPDGMMGNADIVMGYANSAGNCLRSVANGKVGSAPTEAGNFKLSDASFIIENGIMQLTFTRPLTGKNPIVAGGNYVITAAGSTAAVPEACDTELSAAFIHDMHNFVQPSTKFGLLSAGPGPSPGPAPGPAPGPSTCSTSEYCCPDAKHCLTPSNISCAKMFTACDGSAYPVCCPVTKLCVKAGNPCTSPCADQGSYCCPDAKHCLTPTKPGVLCAKAGDCTSEETCCPLTKICVKVGDPCVPAQEKLGLLSAVSTSDTVV